MQGSQSAIEILVTRALSEGGMIVKTVFHSTKTRTVTNFFERDQWDLERMSVSDNQFSMVLMSADERNAIMLWSEPELVDAWVSLLQRHASRLPGHQQEIHLNLSRTMLWMESGIYQPGEVRTGMRIKRPYHPPKGKLIH